MTLCRSYSDFNISFESRIYNSSKIFRKFMIISVSREGVPAFQSVFCLSDYPSVTFFNHRSMTACISSRLSYFTILVLNQINSFLRTLGIFFPINLRIWKNENIFWTPWDHNFSNDFELKNFNFQFWSFLWLISHIGCMLVSKSENSGWQLGSLMKFPPKNNIQGVYFIPCIH